MNGEAPQQYRFMELTRDHQVATLRQQILQLEQALYANALNLEALAARRGQLVEDLQRLQGAVRALLAPPEQPAPEPEKAEAPE